MFSPTFSKPVLTEGEMLQQEGTPDIDAVLSKMQNWNGCTSCQENYTLEFQMPRSAVQFTTGEGTYSKVGILGQTLNVRLLGNDGVLIQESKTTPVAEKEIVTVKMTGETEAILYSYDHVTGPEPFSITLDALKIDAKFFNPNRKHIVIDLFNMHEASPRTAGSKRSFGSDYAFY